MKDTIRSKLQTFYRSPIMAVKRRIQNNSYGFPAPYVTGAPSPIITDRSPLSTDQAEIGQLWIDKTANTAWVLTSMIGNVSNWVTSPAGAGVEAALLVSPGSITVDTGNLSIAGTSTLTGAVGTGAGLTVATTAVVGTDLSVGGNTILTGDLTVGGATAFNGDVDITSTQSLGFTTTANAADAFFVQVNGAAASVATIQNATGTAANSVDIQSVSGGITISGGLGTADAINIVAGTAGGGIDIDASTGGINVAAANGAISILSGTGALNISADAAATTVNFATGAGAKALTIGSTNGASATTVQTGTGAMTLTAGGILDANVVGAVTVDTAAGISLDSATASNFTITGAADLSLSSTAGSVIVKGEEAVNDAIQLTSVAGGLTANVGLDAVITTAGALDLNATGAATLDAVSFSLDSTTASNVSVTGAGQDLTLSSTLGSVAISATEASATAVSISASNAAGGVAVTAGTAGMTVTAPFIELNGIKIYTGAGDPAAGLAISAGDMYIRTNPASAATRLFIATAANTWTNVTCAA